MPSQKENLKFRIDEGKVNQIHLAGRVLKGPAIINIIMRQMEIPNRELICVWETGTEINTSVFITPLKKASKAKLFKQLSDCDTLVIADRTRKNSEN